MPLGQALHVRDVSGGAPAGGRAGQGHVWKIKPWGAAAGLPTVSSRFSKWPQVKAVRPEARGHSPQAQPLLPGASRCDWGCWDVLPLDYPKCCLKFIVPIFLPVCLREEAVFGDKLPGVGIQAGEAYKWLLCAAALIIKPATTALRDFSPGRAAPPG